MSALLDKQVAESPRYRTTWLCEKWSEDAVSFAKRKLDKLGIEAIPGPLVQVGFNVISPESQLGKLRESIGERPDIIPIFKPKLIAVDKDISSGMLRWLVGSPEEAVEVEGNLLVNEGIQRFEDMTMIATLTGTGWNNANAFLGVGDSSTAEAATQTELQAATNRFYKAMNATFPSRSGQTVSFQSDFTTTEANYVWAEWSISSGATTASGSGFTSGTTNLNRKVAALGTKSTGTWTLTAQVTFS